MSGITHDTFSAPTDGRLVRLDPLFNDIDRDSLIELFGGAALAAVEAALTEKNGKSYVHCLVRDKPIQAKREELVRQLWLQRLTLYYMYPTSRLDVEYPVTFGRDTSKRADIVVMDADRPKRARSLKQLIEEMENEVLANAGVDVFEEVFKLIFSKLYDEMYCYRGRHKYLRFRNSNTAFQLKTSIQSLFDDAKKEWPGVFAEDEKIKLGPEHLQVCVGSLEEWKLFNSNLDVVDDAFEYLVGKSSKDEKGQYFTPRWVIDMCVRMMNPHESETVIDTAAGSAGFTVHSIFPVWRQILADEGLPVSHLFTMEDKPQRCRDYVRNKVFAIDFDDR